MALTKKQQAFRDEMSKHLRQRADLRTSWITYARHVQAKLEREGKDETDLHAEFLAIICNGLDAKYDGQLCFEWMLEHYIARGFQQVYPWIKDIWKYLVENGHSFRRKLEYFNDAEAFFVDTKRPILVFGQYWKGDSRYLVIDDKSRIQHRCFVRRIWHKTRLNCIGNVDQPTLKHYRDVDFQMRYHDGAFRIYGDARDRGHVLTYEESLGGGGRCDKVIWNVNEPIRFFFEVNALRTQIVGEAGQGTEAAEETT